MQFKACTEQYLKDSGLNYTIFRLCAFMQVRGSACDRDLAGSSAVGLQACVTPAHLAAPVCQLTPVRQCDGQLCLLQAIIGNYAVPILEEKQVWGTTDETRTAYLDTTDVAKMTLAALRCVVVCLLSVLTAQDAANIGAFPCSLHSALLILECSAGHCCDPQCCCRLE